MVLCFSSPMKLTRCNPGRFNKGTLHNDVGKCTGTLQGQDSTLQWEVGPSREHSPEPGRTVTWKAIQKQLSCIKSTANYTPNFTLLPQSSPAKTPWEANCGNPYRVVFLGPTAGWRRGKKEDGEGGTSLAAQWLRICLAMQEGFPSGSDGKESACNVGDLGSIPGSGRSPREGNGIPFQYSCLEDSMDRRACCGCC